MSLDPKPMTSTVDVLIVGGGLAGLALAVALRQAPLSLALIETRSPPLLSPSSSAIHESWDARIYAISPSNARFLDEIGIWSRLVPHDTPARITPIEHMTVKGDAGGRIDFSAYESHVNELGWIVESSLLQRELWETARRQGNLTLICPARPQTLQINTNGAQLQLEDGRTLSARLVVAADGADSWTRQAAGIDVQFQSYEQMGVVANFTCSQPHRGTAFQWFRRDGVLAWLPLPEQRISMVWSTPERHARELLALSPEALCQHVAAAGEKRLGDLSLLTPPAAFPLRLMRAPRLVIPRLALIGDAAHTIHPLSGHGINLGFKDAQSLADCLLKMPAHIDYGDLRVLRQYERSRVEEIIALQSFTHALQRLFQPQHAPLIWLRNTGLNLTHALPVIKQGLIRYALG